MKRLGVFLLIIALPSLGLAQREITEDTPHTLKDRVYFGGGFGLNSGTDPYGNTYFFYSISPIIGYMIKPNLSAGTGINWQQTSYDRPSVTLTQYGVSPFIRYNFDQLFAHAEYNYISTPTFLNSNERRSFSRMLLGVGYSQPLGGRGAINAMALYDVLYNQNDRAFASPWVFRVFFSF
jgi:hypothetical protein